MSFRLYLLRRHAWSMRRLAPEQQRERGKQVLAGLLALLDERGGRHVAGHVGAGERECESRCAVHPPSAES